MVKIISHASVSNKKQKEKDFITTVLNVLKPVLKFSYKKDIVSCTVDTTKYENGRVSKKQNFQPGSFSFSPTIETSAPENFSKFDLTTQKLNQNVGKLNKTKPNTIPWENIGIRQI